MGQTYLEIHIATRHGPSREHGVDWCLMPARKKAQELQGPVHNLIACATTSSLTDHCPGQFGIAVAGDQGHFAVRLLCWCDKAQ